MDTMELVAQESTPSRRRRSIDQSCPISGVQIEIVNFPCPCVTGLRTEFSVLFAAFSAQCRAMLCERVGQSLLVSPKRGSGMSFLWFLVVGLVAGWLAGMLVKGGGFGLIGDLVVGVIGAFLGGWLFSTLGASAGGGLLGIITVATVGAIVLLFIVRLVKRA